MTLSPTASADETALNLDFWEHRYQEGTPRWDLGQPAPPLVHLLAQNDTLVPGKIAVLGCGHGHDALLFARHGFDVVGVDFAPSAIATAQQAAQRAGLPAQFLQRNLFDLLPEYAQQFDYVLEHTCFCALEPEWRDRYVELVHQLLKPQGKLIGLFFTHSRPGGPPYGSTAEELDERFSRCLQRLSLVPVVDSVPSRQHEEHLGIFQKR
jgi:SAM-dependent methyltransferase